MSLRPQDVLVLRIHDGTLPVPEMSFTGMELETALAMAKQARKRGRVSLVAYNYRPTAPNGSRVQAVVIYPEQQTRKSKKVAEEAA